VPLLGTVIYLTSSGGAVATAAIAIALFVALTPLRWLALGTLLVTGVAAGIAIALVERRAEVANGVSGSTNVALILLAVALATAAIFAMLLSLPVRRSSPGRRLGGSPRVLCSASS
jgi:hypothetical protein